MKKTLVINLILLPLLFIPFFSCRKKSSLSVPNEHSDEYSYQIPEQTDDGWETVSLSEVRMDEEPIIDLVDAIRNEEYHEVHSIVIVKDEKLVFETYFPGHDFGYTGENFHGTTVYFNRNTLHNTHTTGDLETLNLPIACGTCHACFIYYCHNLSGIPTVGSRTDQ